MQQYVRQNPNAQCVQALPPADRVGFGQDRAWITDAQARLVAVAYALDIFSSSLTFQINAFDTFVMERGLYDTPVDECASTCFAAASETTKAQVACFGTLRDITRPSSVTNRFSFISISRTNCIIKS